MAPEPPPPERELWPWLLALLVLVLVGLGVAYLLARDDNGKSNRAARATTTVVETQATVVTRTAPTRTAALPTETPPAAAKQPAPTPKPKPQAKNPPAGAAPNRVAVPNVLGISSGDAVSHLRNAGLGARVVQVFSDKPSGTVVAQSPDPSAKMTKGSVVTLQASKGARPVDVPDVRGQDQQQAVAALERLGLKARIVAVPSVKPVGTIVAQWPRPGAELPAGRSVQLNAARTAPKGQHPPPPTAPPPPPSPAQTPASPPPPPEPVTAPDVTGLELPAARRKLRAAGLVTEVRYVPSQEPVGTIVSQAPKPGAQLKSGDHLLVNASDASQAPQPSQQASVPDVVGQDEEAATNALQQAGFGVDVVDVSVDAADQDGLVQDEQPAGGAQAPAGSDVTLYIGRFSQTG